MWKDEKEMGGAETDPSSHLWMTTRGCGGLVVFEVFAEDLGNRRLIAVYGWSIIWEQEVELAYGWFEGEYLPWRSVCCIWTGCTECEG